MQLLSSHGIACFILDSGDCLQSELYRLGPSGRCGGGVTNARGYLTDFHVYDELG